LFGIVRWPPVAEEAAHRWKPNRFLSRLARSPLTNVAGLLRPLRVDCSRPEDLHPLASPEEVMDLPIHDSTSKLTCDRSQAYMRWRFFSGRDTTAALFAFHSLRTNRDILVAVNQRQRGYRGQINTLNVLDVYPDVAPEEYACIVGALVARYRKEIDAVVLRSQDSARRDYLQARGFQWRQFDAPNGWFLDRAKLLPTQAWYPVPADGDGLI
jgi:hypothetical protein